DNRLPGAVMVPIVCSVRLEWIGSQLKVARIYRSEQTTTRANHPARKGSYGDAHQCAGLKGMLGSGSAYRWREQLFDLRTQHALNRLQQSLFRNLLGFRRVPVIQAHDEC